MSFAIRRARAAAVLATVVLGAGTLAAGLSGCGSGPAIHRAIGDLHGAVSYWTRHRLLAALPWQGTPHVPRPTPSAHTAFLAAARVGAIFSQSASGNHFCTASVVDSPGHDLLITAAHCISGGKNGGLQQNIVFIPDYRDGTTPYGVWTPSKLFVDPQWANSSDPDYDVGFVVLSPLDGKNIEDVLGANRLGFYPSYTSLVRVTGYPASADAPVTCRNLTGRQSATQLKFDCGGYFSGTSGSPWVTAFNPVTRTGTIIGVIGGYQEGGDTPAISYSSYFGTSIKQLYQHAESES
ncbi:MAG TPA: serine protease [Trebonia sp.]